MTTTITKNNFMQKLYNLFNNKVITVLLGFVIFSYFIWFRFIRERLPRDIPFNLSLITVILLMFLICIYIYTIINLIRYIIYSERIKTSFNFLKPKQRSFPAQLLVKYLFKLYKPVILLDKVIKENIYIKALYIYIFKSLTTTFTYNDESPKSFLIYFICNELFSIIIILAFIIDIFYFHKINLSYIFIPLALIPLINKYIVYSMKERMEEYTSFLEKWYKVNITTKLKEDDDPYCTLRSIQWDNDGYSLTEDDNQYLYVRRFIAIYTVEVLEGNKPYTYEPIIRKTLAEKYNPTLHITPRSYLELDPEFASGYTPGYEPEVDLSENEKIELKKDFYELMPLILNMTLFTEIYKYKLRDSKTIMILIIIRLLYLICWGYILIISLPTFTLSSTDIVYIKNFHDIMEPFSNIPII